MELEPEPEPKQMLWLEVVAETKTVVVGWGLRGRRARRQEEDGAGGTIREGAEKKLTASGFLPREVKNGKEEENAVVIPFSFVVGSNGRMQPMVMAPKTPKEEENAAMYMHHLASNCGLRLEGARLLFETDK